MGGTLDVRVWSHSLSEANEQEIARILADVERGAEGAADRLLPLVYDELRRLADGLFRRERAGHTLQPTALVHEAYVRLVKQTRVEWTGCAHFMAVGAQAMRRILINHAESRRAAKRGGAWQRVTLTESDTPAPVSDVDLLALNEALAKLEALDERQCRVVELRFFGGLTVDEAAEVLGVSSRTVELDWRMARSWLYKALTE